MIRGTAFFVVVWAVVAISITVFRSLSGAEKWSLVKTFAYGGATALIALMFVGVIVAVF
jgi:hypothetical protein